MEKFKVKFLHSLFSKQCSMEKDKKVITQMTVPPASINGQPTAPTAVPAVAVTSSCTSPRQDVSKKLLPAALFFFTFFTVMTVLLIYMDTTVMRHKQFRLNMSREYEMEVSQDAALLVEYIRVFQLKSCASPFPPYATHKDHSVIVDHPQPTQTETKVAQLLNFKRNGLFVEAGAYGLHSGGGSRTEWLEETLFWKGVLLTPNIRDYFRLRGRRNSPGTSAMQACLSTSTHPKEITYQESSNPDVGVMPLGSPSEDFTDRVKCFPLYSILLAARAQNADFLSLACGGCELAVLSSLPADKVHISVIEIVGRNKNSVEVFLKNRGYNVAFKTPTSTLYALHDIPTLKI